MVLFFLALSEMGQKIKNKILLFMTVFLLLLFAGFRYGIETDYWSYYRLFNNKSLYSTVEPGYAGLMHIYRTTLSYSFNGFVFLIAFISITIKYIFFKRLTLPFFALAIYFSLFYLMLEYNTIRHGLAISFLSLAVIHLQKRNIFKYYIFVGIASTIHISSLLFIPVYLFFNKKLNIRTVFILILCATITRFFLFDLGLSVINSTVHKMNNQTFSGSVDRLIIYLQVESANIISLGYIRRLLFIILFIYINSKKTIHNVYFNIYLAGYILYILFMGNDTLSARMSMSFEFFMIPLFANSFSGFTMKKFYAVGVLSFVLFLLCVVALRNGNAIPYKSYLL
jgi:hypothetical protein